MSADIQGTSRSHQSRVRDMQNEHKREIQSLQKNQKQELDFIRNKHQKNVKNLKENNSDYIHEIKQENQSQIANEYQRKQETLEKIKNQISREKETGERELSFLKRSFGERKEKERLKLNNNLQEVEDSFNRQMEKEAREQRVQEQRARQEFDNQNRINALTRQQKITSLKNKYVQEQNKVHEQGERTQSKIEKKNRREIRGLEREHKRQKVQTVKSSQKQINTLTANHQKVMTNTKEDQEARLQNKQKQFEKKFLEMSQAERDQIIAMKDRASNHKNKIKKDLAKFIEHYATKAEDEFYTTTLLNPKIKEKEDRFEVLINVDHHEKDSYNLSGSGRELRLSFNRDFSEELTDQSGSKMKSKKVESQVKTFPVSSPIDQNKITRDFSDGVLKFTIQKA